MRVVGGLPSGGGFKVDVTALRLKDTDNLAVHKQEIVRLLVAFEQTLDKGDGIVFVGHAAPVGDVPACIGELLVDFDSGAFFRL